MLHRRPAGLAAGLACAAALASAPAAGAAGPANVTVRVEGVQSTLVEETALRTNLTPVNKSGRPGEDCTGTSAAGALEQGTGGDWDGPWSTSFGPTYSVVRIFGESYPFTQNNYWSLWLNNRIVTSSLCAAELQEGDEVLFFVDRCDYDPNEDRCTNKPVRPLGLQVPATGRTDAPAEVTVVEYDPQGATKPVPGARVFGAGVDATTNANGKAAVRFGQSGRVRLKAELAGYARSAPEVVDVAAAGGTPAPGGSAPPAVRDTAAPLGRILGIRNGQRFSRKRAPRTLRGTVTPDPSGLRAVKLSLTRSHRGRCQLYSPSRERFRPSRCGRRVYFRIGDRQDWSYLLPSRLGRGRYVLDVVAVDKLGNRDVLARGRSRVVFFVR